MGFARNSINHGFLRWLLAALVSVFVLMLGFGASYYRTQRQQVRQVVEDELRAIAQLKVDQIEAWRGERIGDACAVMEDASLRGAVAKWVASSDPADADRILGHLRAAARYSFFDDVLLVDSNGSVRLSVSGSLVRIGGDDAVAVAAALLDKRAVVTDLHLCPDSGAPVMDIAVPLLPSSSLAVLLRCDARTYLYPVIQSWPTPRRSAETYLVRREGDAVLFLSERLAFANLALRRKLPLTLLDNPAVMAVMGKVGFVEGHDSAGTSCLAFLCAVPGTPWSMVARIDSDEAYSSWRMQSALIVGLMLLLVAVAFSSAGFVWQWIRKEKLLHERMAAQELVQEYLERLQIATRAARIGIWDWNVATNVLIWDDTIYELYGVPHGFFKGGAEEWSEYIHPGDRSRVLERLQAALRGEGEYAPEFRIIWPDGTTRFMKANSKVFFDANHKPLRMVGTNIDITDRIQAQEEIRQLNAELEQRVRDRTAGLEAANKELESFSYSVSHDLRAPLRAVDGFSQVLLEDYSSVLDDEGRDYLGRIRVAAGRMGQLIDDMLKLSRISRAPLRRQPVDMNAMALGILHELRERDPDRRVELVVAKPLKADADPDLMRIALENLLGNAWKFTGNTPGARIEVGQLPQPSPQVPATFFVKDNGAGFDMAYADKLFNAFQRLHRQEEFPGTGVGLATVARVIRLHGGEIRAEGNVGQGATFMFTLAPGHGAKSGKEPA